MVDRGLFIRPSMHVCMYSLFRPFMGVDLPKTKSKPR